MRLYKFVGKKWALENIVHRRLKVSTQSDANDIFEFNPFQFSDSETRQYWSKLISNSQDRLGFLSFSSDWRNPLMWSHYADNHSGLCYGIDVPDELVAPVNYIYKRKMVSKNDLRNTETRNEIALFAISTKSSHWKYEKEFRQFIKISTKATKSQITYHPLETQSLKEVIIGDKSPITSKEIVAALGNQTNIKITTSRPAFRSFKIVTQMKKSLQR